MIRWAVEPSENRSSNSPPSRLRESGIRAREPNDANRSISTTARFHSALPRPASHSATSSCNSTSATRTMIAQTVLSQKNDHTGLLLARIRRAAKEQTTPRWPGAWPQARPNVAGSTLQTRFGAAWHWCLVRLTGRTSGVGGLAGQRQLPYRSSSTGSTAARSRPRVGTIQSRASGQRSSSRIAIGLGK